MDFQLEGGRGKVERIDNVQKTTFSTSSEGYVKACTGCHSFVNGLQHP